MTDNFPYQLCKWQHKLSDLNSVLETLIKGEYEIRQNDKEGKYNKSSWKEYKYYYAVFTSGNGILKQNYRKNA